MQYGGSFDNSRGVQTFLSTLFFIFLSSDFRPCQKLTERLEEANGGKSARSKVGVTDR